MVKKFMKFLGYALFFLLVLMAFMPKESFYYKLEELLQKEGVIISGEQLHSHLFSLEIEHLLVSFKGIESAEISNAEVMAFGLYNAVALSDISLSSLVDAYLPSDISKLTLRYSIFDPLRVAFDAKGDFGEARGSFAFLDRHLLVELMPSTLMQMQYAKSLRVLKKEENGGYSYAKTF